MGKEYRVDKLKNLAKVSEMLVENPHATLHEIANAKDIAVGTAHSCKKELERNGKKDDTIAMIVNNAKESIEMTQKIFQAYRKDVYDKYYEEDGTRKPETTISREDMKILKDYAKDDLQRVTVFGGDITDEGGGLKEVRGLLDDIID